MIDNDDVKLFDAIEKKTESFIEDKIFKLIFEHLESYGNIGEQFLSASFFVRQMVLLFISIYLECGKDMEAIKKETSRIIESCIDAAIHMENGDKEIENAIKYIVALKFSLKIESEDDNDKRWSELNCGRNK